MQQLENSDAWKPYRRWLRASFKPSTYDEYLWRSDKFLQDQGITTPKELEKLSPSDIIEYLDKLGSPRIYAYAIINLLRFNGQDSLASKVPTPPTYVQKIPQWLPEPVIRQVIIEKHAPDSRMAALSAVTYDLGLRAGEVLMLNVGPQDATTPWIDLNTGHANILREKTRAFPWQSHKLSEWTHKLLLTYVSGVEPGEPLFRSKHSNAKHSNGERFSYDALFKQWEFWMAWMGCEHLKFHCLRHSRLTWMAVEGKDLVDIMRFAGHATLNSTSIYLHMGAAYRNNPLSTIESLKESKIYQEAVSTLGSP